MKICTTCHIEKEITEFPLNRKKNGYANKCISCSRAATKKYREKYRENNIDKIRH